MAGEGGNIIRNVFGKSYKEAESIMKDAYKGALDFGSPHENTFYGKEGGKKLNNYTDKKNRVLLVKKLKGPIDIETGKIVEVIEKGKQYNYEAIEFNREPTKAELKNLRWGIKYDDGDISELANVIGAKAIGHNVAKARNVNKMSVYAYFIKPNEDVSVKVSLYEEEILIVVGTEQHSQTYGNKLMFPAQAVREIRENYRDNKYANIIIFKDQFTEMELSIIKRDAKKWNNNLYFKQINSVSELIDYINKGDNTINRQRRKISTIKIFCHGLPSILDFGLDGKNEDNQRFKIEHVSKLKKELFTDNSEIYSYACRTGNSDGRILASRNGYEYDEESIKLVKPETSLAQRLAEHLNAKVYAYLKRSNYTSTWLDGGNKQYTKDYITIEDEEVSNPLNPKDWFRKGWDEALWNSQGAFLPPTSGSSPGGVLEAGLFIFEKGKKPKKQ